MSKDARLWLDHSLRNLLITSCFVSASCAMSASPAAITTPMASENATHGEQAAGTDHNQRL